MGGVILNLVLFHGKKFGEDKDKFFEKADIFVFPTFYFYECFPLVLLEAMEHGLPCIATDEGGIPGIVKDGRTGLIVPKRSPQSLADGIARLIDDEALRLSMGKAGYESFKQAFTLPVFERRMVEVLRDVI